MGLTPINAAANIAGYKGIDLNPCSWMYGDKELMTRYPEASSPEQARAMFKADFGAADTAASAAALPLSLTRGGAAAVSTAANKAVNTAVGVGNKTIGSEAMQAVVSALQQAAAAGSKKLDAVSRAANQRQSEFKNWVNPLDWMNVSNWLKFYTPLARPAIVAKPQYRLADQGLQALTDE
jgi:hypothetical protein